MRALLAAAVVLSFVTPVWAESLNQIKVVNDRAPDCSSLESIVESVTRDCKTDDERAIAIYNFCRYAYYHFAYPREKEGVGALKMINVYGWSLCGGQHTVLSAVWEAAGWEWRYRGWPGHTTVEASYGGRWHYFDTFLKFYAWMPDPSSPGGRTVAGQLDINANPGLVTDAFVLDQARKVWYHKDNRFDYIGDKVNWTAPAFMVCGDRLEGVISGCKNSRRSGSPRGWAGIKFDEPDYSTDVNLGVGYSLTLNWDKVDDGWYHLGRNEHPRHTCNDKDYRNSPVTGPLLEPYLALSRGRTYSNGTLLFQPDLSNDAFMSSFEQTENVVYRGKALHPQDANGPGVVVIKMASPYVAVKASGSVASAGAKVEVSTDLKTWQSVDPDDFSDAVVGRYRYDVRITFEQPITDLRLLTLVQHNQEALPYLAPGNNKITVTAANPESLGGNRVVVTYGYCPGSRQRSPEELFDRDAEIGRAHYAEWSDTPVVVQQVVDRFPATFEVPIATPKDRQPVYPRMRFLRREVLAPGQKPLPLEHAPSQPKVGPGETLATLPNPWTMGITKPPKMDDRPTEAVAFTPTHVGYVSKSGEVYQHHFIKWLKDNSDAWILLVDFQGMKLPDPKRLAAAKLVVHVIESHDKAPMQVAAVSLNAPFDPARAYDFANLGDTVGWTIFAKGGGPDVFFDPPRKYEIDITRAVRTWARGETRPHGLAVRIVPNRGVDDGWTVRFSPAKDKPVQLKIETYSD